MSVALITGVGPGTGAALARRFAEGGYQVAMLADESQAFGMQKHLRRPLQEVK